MLAITNEVMNVLFPGWFKVVWIDVNYPKEERDIKCSEEKKETF